MTKILDENQPVEQAGFGSDFSMLDHLQATNQLIEKVQEFNLKVSITFVDYNKAFDSVGHKYVL
jgi:ATP-dependent phosphoenolpyruvate carboxykinase